MVKVKAILCNHWGAPDSLKLGELPEPTPNPGQIIVRPRAWGVNYADLVLIGGTYHAKPRFPFAPGMEVAGEVVARAPDVSRFTIGQRVAAYVEHGGYAELVAAEAAATIALPDSMDWPVASAFAVTYGTAHVALRRRANLQRGETLLVYGAAGGVGLAAVEIGRRLGATVIAAASTAEKLAVVRDHGADHLIDYTREDVRDRVRDLTGGRGADVIYDPVGGDVFDTALRCVAFEGRIVVIGFASGRIPQVGAGLVLIKGCSIVGSSWTFTLKHHPDVIATTYAELLRWYDEGALRPHVSHLLPFHRAAEALQLLAERRVIGKIVLTA